MEKDFCMGILAGMLGGAIVAANSFKVRKTIKDGQQQILDALNKLDKREKKQTENEENWA